MMMEGKMKVAAVTRNIGFALLLLTFVPALAAAPVAKDYAQGIQVDALSERPLVEALLPDDIYRTVTRADLSDVRVFNADGAIVPHAFCAAPSATESTVTHVELPVFEVQGAAQAPREGASIDLRTAGGTAVRVQEAERQAAAGGTQTLAHVIDARVVSDALRSIQFDWKSPDGASEARVRVESSEDLDRWQTIVGASTLIQVTRGDQELRRQTVPLPLREYEYLRVVRADRGPALEIASVVAERLEPSQPIEPLWFSASAVDSPSEGILLFDSARLAPVSYARLVLPQENTSMSVTIESRAGEDLPWRQQWSGEFYSIVNAGERRFSPPAEFASTSDRYWRVSSTKTGEGFSPAPGLELGYRPARLRFLAQGAGPFTLAFGSRRAEAAPTRRCDGLLADVSAQDMAQMIGAASLGPAQSLGGEVAFKPLPKKTPMRLFILWGVLIAGVLLLLAMALSLLKRLNESHGRSEP